MIPICNLQKIFNQTVLGWFLLAFSMIAKAGYYDSHAKGWHWYESIENEGVEAIEEQSVAALPPLEAIKAIKKDLNIKRAKAILTPSEDNVYQYIKSQEQWTAQAEKFADMWQWVIAKYPELNYSLQHPTSELGKRVEHEQRLKSLNKAIDHIRQEYGLFYFYRSNCAYCDKFSPILKNFAKENRLTILPISMDGGPNKSFKSFKTDNGIAEKWGVTHVPALFAVSPGRDEIIPIAFGLVSQSELEQRFLALVKYSKEKASATLHTVNHQP